MNGVNGFKVKLGDVKEFKNQIKTLWNDPELCKSIGVNARMDYERKYVPEMNYEELNSIYKEVLGGSIK